MELTKEILEKNGFENNHPERVLAKYYYDQDDYHIQVENVYFPMSNVLGWEVYAWKGKSTNMKRITLSTITTVEELQSAINLCSINLLIYCNV